MLYSEHSISRIHFNRISKLVTELKSLSCKHADVLLPLEIYILEVTGSIHSQCSGDPHWSVFIKMLIRMFSLFILFTFGFDLQMYTQ